MERRLNGGPWYTFNSGFWWDFGPTSTIKEAWSCGKVDGKLELSPLVEALGT